MIPPELKPYLPEIITAVVGLFFGWLFTRLAASAKISAGNERLKAEERRSADGGWETTGCDSFLIVLR